MVNLLFGCTYRVIAYQLSKLILSKSLVCRFKKKKKKTSMFPLKKITNMKITYVLTINYFLFILSQINLYVTYLLRSL